jgi:peptidoglycan/xylan/chitin deacetylase (PgdA/CDA1 family)
VHWRPSQPGGASARRGAVFAVVAAACASLSCSALYRYKVRDLAHDHPDVMYFVDTRAKAVALTLDDGPDARTTPAILDLLRQHGARATFFLITSRVAGNEELVRRMLAEGHEIGNHMVRDEPSIELAPWEFERQLAESHGLLSGFAPVRWFRPGSGHYDERMLRAVDRRGYRLALGSVYPFDPQIRWPWFSKRFVLGNVREGSIVILHDAGSNGKRTLETLGDVLPKLSERGLRVVTLSELERLRGAAAPDAR